MKTLRIGLIGASGRGDLGQKWHRPDTGEALVVAAADVNTKALQSFRKWAGPDAFATADYRELLAREDIDAVGVFTPDYVHEEHALAVLAARKHLYLEKPMAITTEACDRILRAWTDSGVRFMMGFNMRYMPVFAKARELIRGGAIGNLRAIWVRHFVGAGGDFYYHDWHALRKNTTSLLLQKGTHDLDMIHWLAGSYSTRVAAFGALDYFGGDKPNDLTCPVCPIRGTCPEAQPADRHRQQCCFREEVDVEDNHVVIMELGNGVKASYLQCHFTPEYLRNYTLIGTQGRIEIDVEKLRIWSVARPNGTTWTLPEPPRTDYEIKVKDLGFHGGADPLITQGFLDMILRDVDPVSEPVAGRMSVAAGCEAVKSLREGGMREVPPLAPDLAANLRRAGVF